MTIRDLLEFIADYDTKLNVLDFEIVCQTGEGNFLPNIEIVQMRPKDMPFIVLSEGESEE